MWRETEDGAGSAAGARNALGEPNFTPAHPRASLTPSSKTGTRAPPDPGRPPARRCPGRLSSRTRVARGHWCLGGFRWCGSAGLVAAAVEAERRVPVGHQRGVDRDAQAPALDADDEVEQR